MKTQDDYSDVIPSDKFWAEFPDGVVGCGVTEHLVFRDPEEYDILQVLEDTIRVFDQTRALLAGMSASEVMEEIDKFESIPVNRSAERQAILHALARAGLSMRTIYNLIPGSDDKKCRAVSVMLNSKPQLMTAQALETAMLADELMLAGDSDERICSVTGIHANTLRSIKRFRSNVVVGYEGALRWCFHRMMEGMPTYEVYRKMQVEFPGEAEHIKPHTVYALVRPHRLERNKVRFGWEAE